jgi:ABC-type branched-subunit amino acid transport system substrate-binding protein
MPPHSRYPNPFSKTTTTAALSASVGFSYDSVWSMAVGLSRAGGAGGRAVVASLSGPEGFQGLGGTVALDSDGDRDVASIVCALRTVPNRGFYWILGSFRL